ncbi:MAG: glycosyltransferase family 4 protein [Salibacteraceae bacterium]
MKPVRILVISNFSGPENSVRPEAEIFLKLAQSEDFEITVMTPTGGVYPKKALNQGLKVIDYRPQSKFDPRAISLIRKYVRENAVDVVQAFNSKAIANAAWALMGLPAKLVGYRGYTGNIRWYDPTCYIDFLNPRVDRMICLAESVRTMMMANGMSASRAITIHKGHDPRWYENITAASLDEFRIPQNTLTAAFVANKRWHMKGLDLLVEALSKLDDHQICVLMIGSNLDDPHINRLIEKHGVEDKIRIKGFREDVHSIVKACDFAISSSRYGEAIQKAIIEASFLGLPTLITDISGNRGMVIHQKTGYVAAANSANSLASGLSYMYQNKQRLKQMGDLAREHITSFLSHEQTVEKYAALYKSLVR